MATMAQKVRQNLIQRLRRLGSGRVRSTLGLLKRSIRRDRPARVEHGEAILKDVAHHTHASYAVHDVAVRLGLPLETAIAAMEKLERRG